MTDVLPDDRPPDVAADRTRIEEPVGGRTLIDALADTAAAHADEPAYADKHGRRGGRVLAHPDLGADPRDWPSTSPPRWSESASQVGDTVAIMATNRIEHLVGDMGAVHAAATPMSIYNTLSPEQVAFIAGESSPKVAILESTDQLAALGRALDAVGTVVVIDAAQAPDGDRFVDWDDFVARGAAYRPRTPRRSSSATGTSTPTRRRRSSTRPAPPATPRAWCSPTTTSSTRPSAPWRPPASARPSARSATCPSPTSPSGSSASTARRWSAATCTASATPHELLATLGEVHPTAFFGVPRVWEKIKTGLSAKLAADPNPDNVKLVQDSMAAALAWVQAQEVGGEMTPEIEAAYDEADAAILGFLKLLLGLDQVTWAGSAAAPMPLEVAKFMAGLGLNVYDVYGMTETCGAVTANGPGGFRLGTVGRATPGMEVTLGEDNEVLVRGPVITPGYHRQEQATRNLIDADGWVHTGDIGTLDEEGFFAIVDRKKELIITSAGKNIAPSNIENYLKESPIVGHAMAIGDNRSLRRRDPHPRRRGRPGGGAGAGIEFTDLADLSSRPEIRAMAQDAVDKANARLSRPEQVKAWELLPEEWTAESEELTPTLKLKRRVVNSKYADVVDRALRDAPCRGVTFDLQAHRGGAGLWPENTLEAFGRCPRPSASPRSSSTCT